MVVSDILYINIIQQPQICAHNIITRVIFQPQSFDRNAIVQVFNLLYLRSRAIYYYNSHNNTSYRSYRNYIVYIYKSTCVSYTILFVYRIIRYSIFFFVGIYIINSPIDTASSCRHY